MIVNSVCDGMCACECACAKARACGSWNVRRNVSGVRVRKK